MKIHIKIIVIGLLSVLFSSNLTADERNRNTDQKSGQTITMRSLLDEMVSFECAAQFPTIRYSSKQVSSYDRRSKSPDQAFWFANDDGSGYVRLDTISGRVEKVLFEAEGPGVVTRIWMTTSVKNGILRFYFDKRTGPAFEIPAYDMSQAPFLAGPALSLIHTNYTPEGNGGNTFMLPLPYQRYCRITFEEPDYGKKVPRYYHINYRTYDANTRIETFSMDRVSRLAGRIAEVNELLLHPPTFDAGDKEAVSQQLNNGDTVSLKLAQGGNAVRMLVIDAKSPKGDYAAMMRNLILKITFDGKETVWCPLSDFSGAGFGSPKVDSWYLSADGKGNVISRWVMPYRKHAEVTVLNNYQFPVDVRLEGVTAPYTWDANTLYFHTSWKQEHAIPLTKYDAVHGNLDWNFVTLNGRGVYRGDLLALYNYAPDWYGEGDEKIYVDDDKFPSHFGTGTEDYYNCSWAPVVPFHTPFGGAPRADNRSSHGFNAFVRTRNLDDIPFNALFRFDLEMISWNPGVADYATTCYWYGDYDAMPKQTSGLQVLQVKVPNGSR